MNIILCTAILATLRGYMVENNIQAYIVPNGDAHNSEYPSVEDKRIAYVSNFTGSAGTVIIPTNDTINAQLWTDGRYTTQAQKELNFDFWDLKQEDIAGTLTQAEWLKSVLQPDDRVGVDPNLYTFGMWSTMKAELAQAEIVLVGVDGNLLDQYKEECDPTEPEPPNPIIIHAQQFSGATIAQKLTQIRTKMTENQVGALVVSELDQIAWTLNLRGGDVENNRIFKSYMIIKSESVELFTDSAKITQVVRTYLNNNLIPDTDIYGYEQIIGRLENMNIPATEKVWLSKHVNYNIYDKVKEVLNDDSLLLVTIAPIAIMKLVKNPTEVQGMKNSHIRDASAKIQTLAWLDEQMAAGVVIDEMAVDAKAKEYRRQINQMGLSFDSITGSGPNGAVIHYRVNPDTNRNLNTTELFLIDSGGQYQDGTTDVTRTVSFGTPTAEEKDSYTRVLKGHIAVRLSVFPKGTVGNRLDPFARQFLWNKGLNYLHGTGHGIGHFLHVHEPPIGISFRPFPDDPGLQENMFLSNEPGYYKVDHYGIRIENIVRVAAAVTDTNNGDYLTFEDITLVPHHTKLIDVELLTDDEISYLNNYHKTVWEVVGAFMRTDESVDPNHINWLEEQTKPIIKEDDEVDPVPDCEDILGSLRLYMEFYDIHAYIVPNGDNHGSGNTAREDKRIAYVSKFTGSSATVIIPTNGTLKAQLWTDGRYVTQARDQLDLDLWDLKESDLPATPTQAEWLKLVLKPGNKVGVDPNLYTFGVWSTMETQLAEGGIELVGIDGNLIDKFKEECDPIVPEPPKSIIIHEQQFAGATIAQKLTQIRAKMTENQIGALVVSELDQIAWTLNLRGADVENNPIFKSYMIIKTGSVEFFTNPAKITPAVRTYLNNNLIPNTNIFEYEQIIERLENLNIPANQKVWLSKNVNFNIYNKAREVLNNDDRLFVSVPPIAVLKLVKNPTEVQGLRNSHIRDSSALIQTLAWLDEQMKEGVVIDEIAVDVKAKEYRSKQTNQMGLSFNSITGSGPNGAIIHYRVTPETNRNLSTSELFLIDSGGQYLDGTTDVTRTVSFGTPTAEEKDSYTRVIKGHIALKHKFFPKGTVGNLLDPFARQFLWDKGMNYMHGTGHGIGYFLHIHEGPISISFRPQPDDPGLQENMFLSNEPGYYKVDHYGIRIENIVRVAAAVTSENNGEYLTFEDFTLVPHDKKLMDIKMMTVEEIAYINSYHKSVWDIVGAYMKADALVEQKHINWLEEQTKPIIIENENGGGGGVVNQICTLLLIVPLISYLIL